MAFDTVVKKIVLFLLLTNYTLAIDFLKTSGDTIVNESNEKIILQGFGLGGWLVLEGYMWNCYIEHASFFTSHKKADIV